MLKVDGLQPRQRDLLGLTTGWSEGFTADLFPSAQCKRVPQQSRESKSRSPLKLARAPSRPVSTYLAVKLPT